MIKKYLGFFRIVRAIVIMTRYGVFTPMARHYKVSFLFKIWIFLCGGYKERGGLSIALNALGPAYIKMGQFFATRRDIIPVDICDELAKLQDNVPPFSREEAIKIIETSFGKKFDEIFVDFSEPMAAASVAQVHFAILKESDIPVAVKVLRPQIHERFAQDIEDFRLGAQILHRYFKRMRRLRFPDVVDTLEEWVYYELDLRMEAASASEYAEKVTHEYDIKIPKIYWDYTNFFVLTMERITGIPLTDLESLQKSNYDLKKIARHIMRVFLKDATYSGFFHGDFHQGNILIMASGRVALLDFGVMGRLDKKSRSYLAEILYGFVTKNYMRIAELHFEAGYVPKKHNIYRFAQALRAVGEPIFGKRATDISMGRVLGELFSVTETFDMQTRPELILLQKNMVTVEGVCSYLDPDSDMWDVARPLLEEWVRERLSFKNKISEIVNTVMGLLKKNMDDLKTYK